jgi:PAS domain S-box-containing protein
VIQKGSAAGFGGAGSDDVNEERLRRLYEADVIGIIISRNDGSVVDANNALLEMLGFTRADLESGALDWRRITPDEWLWLDERAIVLLDTVGVFPSYEKEYVRKDGTRIPILVGGARIEGTDEQICYILDLSERKRAERELAVSESRYRALAESLPHIVVQTDLDGNAVYANRQWHDYTGLDDSLTLESRRNVVHPDDLPGSDALRRQPLAYETEMRLRRADGVYRWHLVRVNPIEGSSHSPAGRIATVIDIEARKRFEESLQFLSTAGGVLSRTLGLQETVEGLLQLVVPQLGDWATINVREADGRIHTIAARHADPSRSDLARRLQGAYFHIEGASIGTPSVYETKRPYFIAPLTTEKVERSIKPEYRQIFLDMGLGSFVAMPIVINGEVVGTFGIGTGPGRAPFTEADLPTLDELAVRAGFALANAQAYEREHFAAQSFQKAALPAELPVVPGIRLDSFYQPATSDAIVGGDWYDAFRLPDGRLVVSIGDVSGHGLGAAVKMSAVRQIIRGIAQIHPDPLTMLEAADRAVRSEDQFGMVTAFTGVIDPGHGMSMSYASAGHLPAIIRRADGTIEELRTPGLPLGYRHLYASTGNRTVLEPGSSLVLFTDGLVEAGHDIRTGEAAVREAVRELDWSGCVAPAQEICRIVLRGAPTLDDVAVLTFCALT